MPPYVHTTSDIRYYNNLPQKKQHFFKKIFKGSSRPPPRGGSPTGGERENAEIFRPGKCKENRGSTARGNRTAERKTVPKKHGRPGSTVQGNRHGAERVAPKLPKKETKRGGHGFVL